MPPLRIWSLTNGGAGMRAQASGLARALGDLLDGEVAEKTVPLSDADAPPEVVVACGSAAVVPALRLKFQHGAFAAYVQRPFFGGALFDAVTRPRHDGPGGNNTLAITGALGPVSAEMLAARREAALQRFAQLPRPRLGALLGGANRAFVFAEQECADIRDSLRQWRDATGGGVLAVASRRTGADNIAVLNDLLWEDGRGNPYMDILAAADILAVTGDSVNMLSEACAAGRPVFVFPPTARPGWRGNIAAQKFFRFHDELFSRGLAKRWDAAADILSDEKKREEWEGWGAPPLDETARAARWLAEKIRARGVVTSASRR